MADRLWSGPEATEVQHKNFAPYPLGPLDRQLTLIFYIYIYETYKITKNWPLDRGQVQEASESSAKIIAPFPWCPLDTIYIHIYIFLKICRVDKGSWPRKCNGPAQKNCTLSTALPGWLRIVFIHSLYNFDNETDNLYWKSVLR